MKQLFPAVLAPLLLTGVYSATAVAKVSDEEAARLGADLTTVGAVRAGNEAGTIPEYVGKASFNDDMFDLTPEHLDDLRIRLVKDIQKMIGDTEALGDILDKAQAIMDSEPGKAAKVTDIFESMLASNADLKKDFDSILSGRGTSVDTLFAQIRSKEKSLTDIKPDIQAVAQAFAAKGEKWMSKLVQAFDVSRILEIVSIVDDPETRVIVNDMLMAYLPPYVRGFLEYKDINGKPATVGAIKPLYVITQDNLSEHKDKLSAGHLSMFETYPDYKMVVYPSFRNAFFPQEIEDATIKNATRASLTGTDGVEGAELGFPFPIPKTGAEPIWNHKLKFRGSTAKRYNNQAIVNPDGTYKISKLVEDVKFLYGSLTVPPSEEKNKVMAYYLQEVLSPVRVAGQLILVHESAGGLGNTRNAWIYSPGLGRVNRAPDVGFDNPAIGSDGEQFTDQIDMFNGSLERYDWKMIGRKEMLIPYNSWVMNSPTFKYKDIIRPGHINQDLARYEMHRVWVVEATLKDGHRHRFGKRRFYIDEDSWSIAVVDCYDSRGELWKVQEAHLVTAPFIPTVSGIPEVIYDLQAKRYFVTALTNEDSIIDFKISYDDKIFKPAALQRRASGR